MARGAFAESLGVAQICGAGLSQQFGVCAAKNLLPAHSVDHDDNHIFSFVRGGRLRRGGLNHAAESQGKGRESRKEVEQRVFHRMRFSQMELE